MDKTKRGTMNSANWITASEEKERRMGRYLEALMIESGKKKANKLTRKFAEISRR